MKAYRELKTDISLNDVQFCNTLQDYEEFVYIVSHDFSAPIRQINEFVKLLTQSFTQELISEQKLYVHYIQDSLKRMTDMQEALLTLSRITSGDYSLKKVDIHGMVEGIVSSLEYDEYQTQPRVKQEKLMPAYGVETMLDKLFRIVIDNACRYGSENGEQKVHIKSYVRQNEVVYEVSDNGIGIDNAFCEVVFNMFRRLHGQKDYGGGVGAGLTIAQKIISYHQGHIWIKSKLGEGTSVLFSLPKSSNND